MKEEAGKAPGDSGTTVADKARKIGGKARATMGDVKDDLIRGTR